MHAIGNGDFDEIPGSSNLHMSENLGWDQYTLL